MLQNNLINSRQVYLYDTFHMTAHLRTAHLIFVGLEIAVGMLSSLKRTTCLDQKFLGCFGENMFNFSFVVRRTEIF